MNFGEILTYQRSNLIKKLALSGFIVFLYTSFLFVSHEMLIKRRLINGLIAVALVLWITKASVGQVYHFQHYDIFSGLGQSQVSDIEQDRFGYIWLSTRGGGLSRFDGKHFTTYRKEDNLPANNILSLEIDAKGLMYIGTPLGLSVYDGKKNAPGSLTQS